MRRRLYLSAVVGLGALTGCAQIFGLDVTSSTDANDEGVSLSLTRASVGATVIKNPLDVSMQTATFLVEDGAGGFTTVAGEVSGPGRFTAPIATGSPAAQFTLPDNKGFHVWALGARSQRGNYVVFEHPGAEPPLPTSEVAISATLPTPLAAGESFRVEVIGAWMQATPMAPAVGETAFADTIPYSTFTPMHGNAPARFTSADVLLFLRYSAGRLTGVLQTQLDQTAGTDTLGGSMTAVPATSSLDATIDPAALTTRYMAVRPSLTTTVAQNYYVRAAPGVSVGPPVGPLLVTGSPTVTATSIAASFGNPFVSLGWTSAVEYGTSMSRTYMLDTMHAVALSAQLTTVAEVTTQPLTLDSPVGLPITIQINATPLTADGTNVMLDLTKPVVVDATLDRPTNTLYSARVIELSISGPTVVREQVAEVLVVGRPTFKFPPEAFEVGHTYFVQVTCFQGGFSDVANGDLQSVTLPYSVSALDSGVFTVTP